MKQEKANEIGLNDGVSDSRCSTAVNNTTASKEELSATHNLETVNSETQLKDLAEILSASIEVHTRLSRDRDASVHSSPHSLGEEEMKIINDNRIEFESLFKNFLNPNDEQRRLINSLHRYIVGNDNVDIYRVRATGIDRSAIDMFIENPVRVDILTISQAMVLALFNNEKPRAFDPEELFRVWFNQIIAVTADRAAALYDQSTSICMDCLSKEPLFQKVRKVISNFLNQEIQRASRLTKDKPISTKKLLKNLDPLLAQITESTFVELANELGSFSGDYIELRKPTGNEIN